MRKTGDDLYDAAYDEQYRVRRPKIRKRGRKKNSQRREKSRNPRTKL